MTLPALLDIKAAAAALGVSTDWLGRQASAGKVPSRKVGRRRVFTEEDLASYLDRVREGTVDPFARTATQQRRRRSA